MKFAKILLVMAVLAPSVASAQSAPPTSLPLGATNFAFLLPLVGFLAVPVVLGENNNTVSTR